MAGRVGKAVWGAALLLAACKEEPTAPVVDHLLGAWCMQSEVASADGPRMLGGSKWELRSDGTYSYAYKWHRWDEPWSRSGDTLQLGKLGAHQIEKLDASALELAQGNARKYFGRDCGPEYAKAERVHALVEAAGDGKPEAVAEELARGADIDGIDKLGVVEQTALIAAVRGHHVPLVTLLLERGARHDVATSEGITAMNAAEIAGHNDIVELLLKAGARPSARLPPPRTPTAEELETARVQKLLNLYPGALMDDRGRPPAPVEPATTALAPVPAGGSDTPQPAPSPKKEEPPKPEQNKEVEALKKELCSKRPANLDGPLSAEMVEMLKGIGMSPAEYIAQQKAIYEQACK